jgi:type I restriction enzyme S subunit
MGKWRQQKLGDVLKIKHGFAFKGEFFSDAGEFVLLTPGNFEEGGGLKLKGEKEKYYTGEFPDEFLLRRGDLLVAMTDLTQNAPILGSPAFIPEDGCFLHNQRLGKIVNLKTDEALPEFVFYLFNTASVRGQIKGSASGATVRHTSPSRIYNVSVTLPPLPVQRRIAGILLAYDELMENSQRRIRILEAMARALYREWFVHFRFPGHEKLPRVASPLGDIPQGWEGRFGDLATIERDGINPFEFPEEEFEHFSIPAFDNGRQPAIELGATILSGKYCIEDSTVLLSKLNPRIPRIWLPVPSGQRRAITSTEFLGLKPQPGVTREFIYAKCCSDEFAGQFGSLAIGTSTSHQRVKPENLLAMPSAVPDRKTIARFTKLVSPMLTVCQQLRSQIQNLRRTRDLLLPKLISGEIDVSELGIETNGKI